jgi:hypothetical protein
MFVVQKGLPYFCSNGKLYACTIDAFNLTVDFKKPIAKTEPITYTLNENELRNKFGIYKVDSWDSVNNKVIKISNKTVSSMVTSRK